MSTINCRGIRRAKSVKGKHIMEFKDAHAKGIMRAKVAGLCSIICIGTCASVHITQASYATAVDNIPVVECAEATIVPVVDGAELIEIPETVIIPEITSEPEVISEPEITDISVVEDTNIKDKIYRTDREAAIKAKTSRFVQNKSLKEQDVYRIKPTYNEDGKMVIGSRSEAMCLDIREPSNWTAEDLYSVLNKEMHILVPTAIAMEKELGINALYIIAVGANETGWGKYMAGRYNYFNWTHNGINHFNYASIEEFTEDSIERYAECYMSEDNYTHKVGFTPSCIVPEVVNMKYAIHLNGSTNWQWSNVVTEIMAMLSTRLYG